MPSSESRSRRAPPLVALAILLAACADVAPPSPTPDPAASASARPSQAATPSPTRTGIELPQAGHPFDAGMLLGAMRESRRPGGVPDELETDAIASALADAIWTLDGRPWTVISAAGSCGPSTCTLEISGAAAGAHGDDVWIFEIAPATGAVQPQTTDLRSMPTDLVGRLDQLTRSLVAPAMLDGLILTNVRWLPPPDDGQFVLSYRSGGEEGSCGVEVTLDAVAGDVVSGDSSDC
jgi:hypothetical protein